MISSQELSLAKRKLEKYSKDKNEETKMSTLLSALADYSVARDVLVDSDIAPVLREIKKTYADSEAGKMAKVVLNKWKKEFMVGLETDDKPSDSATTTSDGQDEERPAKKVKTDHVEQEEESSPRFASENGEWKQSKFDALPQNRRKIFNLFYDIFKTNENDSLAKVIASGIEQAIADLHDTEKESKLYIQKAQSLIFNLKKNEELKAQLFFGVIEPSRLVTMSSSELAPASLVDERRRQHEISTMARRSDIYDIARQEIQKANGLNQESEFKCRKCKGTRTSHYAMQTRSSDEPMTIFVCCLNCGNRWRE